MQYKELVWRICLRKRKNEQTILDDISSPFTALPNPQNGWAADPFLIEKDGIVYIFAELFSYKTWKGAIGYCTYLNNTFSEWKNVIFNNTHFSFPNIYKLDGEIFMMPENSESRKIPIYRAKEFPNIWEELMPAYVGSKMVDTVFMPDGRLLSYNIEGNEYSLTVPGTELLTKDQLGLLRPGGKFFKKGEKWFRPAQDCSRVYGGALHINELVEINANPIKEVTIRHIEPQDVMIDNLKAGFNLRWKALHTYNFSEHYEAIDVQYEKFSWKYLFTRLIAKLLQA